MDASSCSIWTLTPPLYGILSVMQASWPVAQIWLSERRYICCSSRWTCLRMLLPRWELWLMSWKSQVGALCVTNHRSPQFWCFLFNRWNSLPSHGSASWSRQWAAVCLMRQTVSSCVTHEADSEQLSDSLSRQWAAVGLREQAVSSCLTQGTDSEQLCAALVAAVTGCILTVFQWFTLSVPLVATYESEKRSKQNCRELTKLCDGPFLSCLQLWHRLLMMLKALSQVEDSSIILGQDLVKYTKCMVCWLVIANGPWIHTKPAWHAVCSNRPLCWQMCHWVHQSWVGLSALSHDLQGQLLCLYWGQWPYWS